MPNTEPPPSDRSGEIIGVFLKLGTTAFGGPAAHIAMMEDEVVRRRGWVTRERFLDLVGATNLIPGPNSTELAIHLGYIRGGWPGLVMAGVSFIVPAASIVTALGWSYVRFGKLPEVAAILYGVKPVIIAIVAQALWRLGRTAVKSAWLGVLALAAIAAVSLGVNELVVLAASAVLAMAARVARGGRVGRDGRGANAAVLGPSVTGKASLFSLGIGGGAAAAVTMPAVTLGALFAAFLKIGAVLFGSGYVLLAFLRADFVERLHWLTEQQLLDAVVVGQITPGPVFTTATFIGYLLAGGRGALVATLGIFLPAFVFVAISGPLVPRIRRSRTAGAALDGVNVASLALMAVVTAQLAKAALVDGWTIVIAAASVVVLFRIRLSSAWLVLAGAATGLARLMIL